VDGAIKPSLPFGGDKRDLENTPFPGGEADWPHGPHDPAPISGVDPTDAWWPPSCGSDYCYCWPAYHQCMLELCEPVYGPAVAQLNAYFWAQYDAILTQYNQLDANCQTIEDSALRFACQATAATWMTLQVVALSDQVAAERTTIELSYMTCSTGCHIGAIEPTLNGGCPNACEFVSRACGNDSPPKPEPPPLPEFGLTNPRRNPMYRQE